MGHWGAWLRDRERQQTVFTVSAAFLVVMGLWSGLVALLRIPAYVLPAPQEVGVALWTGVAQPVGSQASLVYQVWVTFWAAMIGLIAGGGLGLLIGGLAAQFRPLERLFMPYVFGFQTMPKIAIAPLIMIWFGFGQAPGVILAGMLAFFPMVVNTYAGMNLVDFDHLQVFRSFRASRAMILMKLRLPTALPLIFAGLEIAIIEALLGAVVAEFIAGQAGAGTTILRFEGDSQTASVFAVLIMLAILGIVLHVLVRVLRGRLVFWQAGDSGTV